MAAKEQAVLEVSVTGVDKAASQFSSFQQTTTKTMSASEAAVTRSLKNMVAQFVGIAAVARSVQNVVSSGIGFDRFVEDTTTSFTVMMKSADKAKQQMKDLYDFAVASPLTFKETAASSKQLMAYGFTAEQLIPTMKTLGSVAIATGHSLDDISYVYGTLKSQGRAYSRDLMQFGMRGIPIYEELAEVMKVDVKQIQKMASEGKIGFAEVEQAFKNMTTNGGRFSGIIEGYMTTLTGKLSMLSDIAQQSSGTLMSGVTNQLKKLVDSMTKTLQGGGFQQYIKNLSNDLGDIASVLRVMVTVVVQLLPLLTAFLKIWIAFKALQIASSVLANIPKLLFSIGDAAASAAASMAAFGTGQAAMSALRMGIATVTAELGALKVAAASFIAANPWILVLASIAAAGGAVIIIKNMVESDAAKNRSSKDASVRAGQLSQDYYVAPFSLKEVTQSSKVAASAVAGIASQYQLSDELVADILIKNRALTQQAWDNYKANQALVAQQKELSGEKSYARAQKSMEQIQAEFLGGLTGLDITRYFDPNDTTALGTRGASDYIKGFADQMEAKKKLYGDAFTPDMQTEQWQAEYKALSAALENGKDVTGLFEKTGYDETLIARLVQLNKLLDTTKGKAVAAAKELGKWWAPIVQAAKVSIDPIDDITVATQQASEAAAKEFNDRQKNYDELIKQAKTEQDAIRYMQMKSSEAALYLQYQKDITAEGEKQKNLKLYETATEGNSAVMDQWKASAGAAYKAGGITGTATGATIQGASQLVSGTQVGTMATGGNPAAVATTSLVDFAKSITNVNAVLNPFTTIFEAMRTTLEPIVNNVLQPLVDILQMVGEALAPIIAVIVASLKPALSILYLVIAPVVGALQILGAGFQWFYNYVIVTVANAIVNIVNAIIKVLNKIPFVHIRYIDTLDKMTDAAKDYTATLTNQKSALDQTIDYLTKKINDAVDSQIDSYQKLYEVGAISASEYEKQVASLNKQKIDESTSLLSAADKQLTNTQQIYQRLYALYDLKDVIENSEGLTDTELSTLMSQYGLSTQSRETAIKNAVLAAMKEYGLANGNAGGTSGSTGAAVAAFTSLATNKVTNTKSDYSTSLGGTTIEDLTAIYDKLISLVGSENATAIKYLFDPSKYNEYMSYGLSSDQALQALQDNLSTLMGYLEGGAYFENGQLTFSSSPKLNQFAVGTGSVPYDMTAQIHKGEGIIPSTFMDSIRSGELTLSSGGKNEGSGQNTIVNVTVQGSVQTENDLASTIATNIYRQRKMGVLTI